MSLQTAAKTLDPTDEKVITTGFRSTKFDESHEYTLHVSTVQDPGLADWPRPGKYWGYSRNDLFCSVEEVSFSSSSPGSLIIRFHYACHLTKDNLSVKNQP